MPEHTLRNTIDAGLIKRLEDQLNTIQHAVEPLDHRLDTVQHAVETQLLDLKQAVETQLDNMQQSVDTQLSVLLRHCPLLWHVPACPTLTAIDFQYYPGTLPNPLQVGDAEITQYVDLAGTPAPHLEVAALGDYIGMRCGVQTIIKFASDDHMKMMIYYFQAGMDIEVEVDGLPKTVSSTFPNTHTPKPIYINHGSAIRSIVITAHGQTMLLAVCAE